MFLAKTMLECTSFFIIKKKDKGQKKIKLCEVE